MADVKTNVKTVWNGDTKGNGSMKANYLNTKIAIPESSGGTGEGTDPKELLVTSAAACYTMTLVAMLEARKLPVDQFTMNSEGTNSREEGFQIIHYPYIILSANATEKDIQSVNRAFTSADKGCAVGNMLKKADVQIDIVGNVSVEFGEEG
ncbi:OsmC family protein [Virgibacillus sp. NKC19-3]|uniref:OsmC family protein n=1 Tax=Virgibacillus saliphilus TaxID=2831674 RepID=UPI001C9A5CA4|nr:OsmC family protein [Virgibacillus sp. NKC19-3]MBY7142001.1 OsmC family protein [Virgibacillus sp. NKC19-3]